MPFQMLNAWLYIKSTVFIVTTSSTFFIRNGGGVGVSGRVVALVLAKVVLAGVLPLQSCDTRVISAVFAFLALAKLWLLIKGGWSILHWVPIGRCSRS